MARNRIEKLKQRLQDFTYEENGQQVKLSPYEKFLIVYKAVANNEYNMSQNYDDDRMRNWIGALSSDKIICSGFSSLLKCICNRVFTLEELKCYNQSVVFYDNDGKFVMSHANNMVMINDPKYNLDGLYYADACADCKAQQRGNQTAFDYCLIPIQQAVELKDMQLTFDKQWFVYKDIGTFYNNSAEVTNSGPTDIMHKFGYKSKQEFIDKVEDIIVQRREQVELNNQQLRQQIEQEFEEFAKKAKFANSTELKEALPSIRTLEWPLEIRKKYKDILEATSFFDNIDGLDSLNDPKVIDQAKKYRHFHHKNSKKFNQLNEELLQYAEANNVPRVYEFSEYGHVLEYIFCKNQERFDEYEERDRLDAEIESRYEQQIDRCIQKGRGTIYAPPIGDKKFAKGLVAMLRFVGYEEDKIKDWVRAEVEKRRAYQIQHFGNVETMLQEENNVDEDALSI